LTSFVGPMRTLLGVVASWRWAGRCGRWWLWLRIRLAAARDGEEGMPGGSKIDLFLDKGGGFRAQGRSYAFCVGMGGLGCFPGWLVPVSVRGGLLMEGCLPEAVRAPWQCAGLHPRSGPAGPAGLWVTLCGFCLVCCGLRGRDGAGVGSSFPGSGAGVGFWLCGVVDGRVRLPVIPQAVRAASRPVGPAGLPAAVLAASRLVVRIPGGDRWVLSGMSSDSVVCESRASRSVRSIDRGLPVSRRGRPLRLWLLMRGVGSVVGGCLVQVCPWIRRRGDGEPLGRGASSIRTGAGAGLVPACSSACVRTFRFGSVFRMCGRLMQRFICAT